jgi:hypothetical protein
MQNLPRPATAVDMRKSFCTIEDCIQLRNVLDKNNTGSTVWADTA